MNDLDGKVIDAKAMRGWIYGGLPIPADLPVLTDYITAHARPENEVAGLREAITQIEIWRDDSKRLADSAVDDKADERWRCYCAVLRILPSPTAPPPEPGSEALGIQQCSCGGADGYAMFSGVRRCVGCGKPAESEADR